MKILTTSTMALGALCIVALNQPAKAELSSNDPNFHLTRGGGGHGGGHHGGGGGRGYGGGGHGYGHHGYGRGYGHGYGWGGGGWGAFGAGVATGAVLGGVGTTVYQNSYSSYPAYEAAPAYGAVCYATDGYGNCVQWQ